MKDRFEILVVDDDASIRKRCVQLLHKKGYAVEGVSGGDVALSLVKSRYVAVVIVDIRMPGINGIELLERIKEISPHTEVVVITGYGTVESAVKAIKLGAYDYLTKPFDMERLLKVIENVSTKITLSEEVRVLRERLKTYSDTHDIVTVSDKMQQIFEVIERVAPIDCNILIQGESGTGKGLIARQIHRRSPRRSNHFVVVDCASLSETLLESELFGHAKGAFTGAYADKEGYFRVADKGTIFLDEISELSTALQGKLLRIAQDHEFTPVGSTKPTKIDARIIAATNKDLDALVRAGHFREDLFFRLNVVSINVPPLRKRREDIIPLAYFFLEKFKKRFEKPDLALDRNLLSLLQAYDWPGNVRELENLMQSLVAMSDGMSIRPEAIPGKIKKVTPSDGNDNASFLQADLASAKKMCVDDFTRKYLIVALRQNSGNVSGTARQIGMRRSSLQRMMKRFGITKAGP